MIGTQARDESHTRRNRARARALLLGMSLGLWILSPGTIGAQIAGGNIVGRIVDDTGGVLPGASVTVTATETGLTRSTATDEGGHYGVSSLPVGTYMIRVSLAEFATQERKLILAVGQTLTVNFTLQPAGIVEIVAVPATPPLVETRSSQVHGVVEVEQIGNLPVNGRDFQALATLVPGVTSGNTAINQNYSPAKKFVPAISINGQNGRNINISIDGGDNNDISLGGQKITLSQEAVQEFEVITQRYRAEHGKGVGGVINVITKRGTNNWRGSVFGFFRADELQGIDAISDSLGADKPRFDAQQVGATVGGPFDRDEAFIFYSYERQSRDTSNVFNSGGAFPTQDGDVVPQPFRQNMNTVRFDLNAAPSLQLFARYSGQDFTVEGELFSPTTAPESSNSEENDFHDGVVGITSLVGNKAVNDFRFHYAWFRNRILNGLSNDEFPTLIFPAGSFGASQAGDQSTKEVAWGFRNDFSLQKGHHLIKLGGSAIHRPAIVLDGNLRKNRFTFANNDFDPVTRTIGPTNQALFLRTWSAPYFSIFNKNLSEFGVYIQDDFTVARTTLNVGVRYDFIHNLFYERDVAASQFIYDQLGRRPKDDKNNLAGRIGVAFDVLGDGNTVIRGGYGRYYDPASVMAATLFEELDRRDLELPPYQFTFIPADLFDALGIVAGEPVPATAIREAFDLGLVAPFNFVNSPDLRVASADQLNVGIAHQLTSGPLAELALDASVVHSRTTGLNAVLLTPEFPALGPTVQLNSSTGKSEYRGLLLSARKRFDIWQLSASYTLSTAKESTNQFSYNPLDFTAPNGRGEFGPTNFDERHRLMVSGVLALPGDVRLSGIVLAASARPWTAGCDCDFNGDGQIASNGPSGSRTFNSFSGDRVEPRGSRRGDPTYSVDIRVSKLFAVGQRARLELMVEVFNLFDAANFGQNIFDNVDDPERFGTPINIITPPRTAQIGVRLRFSDAPPR